MFSRKINSSDDGKSAVAEPPGFKIAEEEDMEICVKTTFTYTSSHISLAIADVKISSTSSPTGSAIAEEFLCPISHELMFEPTTAEDGFLYEYAFIRQHVTRNQNNLRSPITNKPMGPKLLPNKGVKNVIERAVLNEDIVGEPAQGWLEKKQSIDEFHMLKKRAVNGDSTAFCDVAHAYHCGRHGVMIDMMEAKKWWKLAAEAGEVEGLSVGGFALTANFNKAEISQGVAFLVEAAMQDSQLACFALGQLYAKGEKITQNDKLAVKWLRRCMELKKMKKNTCRLTLETQNPNACQELLDEVLARLTDKNSVVCPCRWNVLCHKSPKG